MAHDPYLCSADNVSTEPDRPFPHKGKRKKAQVTCTCAGYSFPHRIGSGNCIAEDPDADDDSYCGHCSGTGMGEHDGSSCSCCGGSGTFRRQPEYDDRRDYERDGW